MYQFYHRWKTSRPPWIWRSARSLQWQCILGWAPHFWSWYSLASDPCGWHQDHAPGRFPKGFPWRWRRPRPQKRGARWAALHNLNPSRDLEWMGHRWEGPPGVAWSEQLFASSLALGRSSPLLLRLRGPLDVCLWASSTGPLVYTPSQWICRHHFRTSKSSSRKKTYLIREHDIWLQLLNGKSLQYLTLKTQYFELLIAQPGFIYYLEGPRLLGLKVQDQEHDTELPVA